MKKITNGRVDYIRAKTHRPYSIKVESEAREIIDRYAGSESLVNFAENYGNYRHFYNNLCKGLGEVKQQLGIEELTTYWARHSWATTAHKLGVRKDVIRYSDTESTPLPTSTLRKIQRRWTKPTAKSSITSSTGMRKSLSKKIRAR
ncbi:MAG: hypothetical protein HDS99_04200 [Bacteroidales bacterium]|nr:hypothetical protein [Bacteroidales bacterium]